MTPTEALHVLGLRPQASEAGIKQAYLDLAKVWHPDRFPDDPRLQTQAQEKFKEINAAYQKLRHYKPPWTSQPRTTPPRETTSRPDADQPRRPPPPQHPPHMQQRADRSFWERPWVIVLGGVLLVRMIAYLANEPNPRPRQTVSSPLYTAPPALPKSRPTPSVSMPNSRQRPPTATAVAPQPTKPPRQAARPQPQSRPPSWEQVLSGQTEGPLIEIDQSFQRPKSTDRRSVTASGTSFITVGSTRDEVLAIEGTPTEFNDHVWKYGLTSVYFSNGRVASWGISPLNPIKARMVPSGPTETWLPYFTVGSTKDEVVVIQGTPTEFNDRVWKYGLTSVYFSKGRVASWDISPLNPIKARLAAAEEPQ